MNSDLYNAVNTKATAQNTMGVGVIIHNPVTNKVLIGFRTDTENYASPGGKVEAGETPLNAVMRETLEECGLTLNAVHLLGILPHKDGRGRNWVSYVFYSNRYEGELVGQQEEIDHFAWISPESAMQYNLFEPTQSALLMAFTQQMLEAGETDVAEEFGDISKNGEISLVNTGEIPVFEGTALPEVRGLYAHGRSYQTNAYSWSPTLEWSNYRSANGAFWD